MDSELCDARTHTRTRPCVRMDGWMDGLTVRVGIVDSIPVNGRVLVLHIFVLDQSTRVRRLLQYVGCAVSLSCFYSSYVSLQTFMKYTVCVYLKRVAGLLLSKVRHFTVHRH